MPPPPSDKQRLRLLLDRALDGAPSAAPACPHFGRCGGCAFQHVAYPAQAAAKRGACAALLNAALGERAPPVALVPSPRPYGYRQRMDYVFAFRKAGLRRRGRHREVVDLDACPLLGEPGFSAFRRARTLAEAEGLESYDYLRFRGELRYFVVRRTRAGAVLLSLVTLSDRPATGEAVARVAAAVLAERRADGVHWLHAPGKGDVSFGAPLAHWGRPWIAERLNGRAFAIGPNSFFQANAWVAERAYAALAAWSDGVGGAAWDLYSGTGVIAEHLARARGGTAGKVLAIESGEENVRLAEAHRAPVAADAADDGAGGGVDGHGVDLRRGDAGAFLRDAADAVAAGAMARPGFVAVNPPRAGLGPDGARRLAAAGAERIAYLSCNPGSLARDAAALAAGGYALRAATVFDMFPQTPHFETLALLERAAD